MAAEAAWTAEGAALALLLGLAGLGSTAILGLALAAFVRRRSRPYLLVALALGTLVARTAVAGVTMTGSLSANSHHLLEHGLDVAMAALVIAAVYYARSVERTSEGSDASDAPELPNESGGPE